MTATDTEVVRTEVPKVDRSWLRLMMLLSGGMVAWAAFITAIVAELIPPIVIFAVLYVIGIYLARRFPRRAGAIFLLVVSVAVTAMGGPFALEALPHPESALDFILSVIQLAAPLAIIVAGVGHLRRWQPRARQVLAYGTAGVVVVLAAVSLAAAASLEDDVAAAQDIRVVAEEVEFAPDAFLADAGTVAVFVDNLDPTRHTFTIEELGVDLELPASTARRVEFEAVPGTYEFFCKVSGHEDMTGELIVGE